MIAFMLIGLLLGIQNQNQQDILTSENELELASQYVIKEDYRQALQHFLSAKAKNPVNIAAIKGYLECTGKVSPVELLPILRDNIIWRQQEPRNIAAQYALAKTYDEIYKWKESRYPTREQGVIPNELIDEANFYRREFEKEINATIQMAPDLVYPYYDLLEWSEEYAKYSKSIDIMRTILKLIPDDLTANLKMASLCFSHMAENPRTVRPEIMQMTIKYSKKVLTSDPDHKEALYYLACAYMQGGHYEKAIELFRKRLALEEDQKSKGAGLCRFWISQMEKEMKDGTRRKVTPLTE